MSRRLRKACKQVIEISKQEGMNFSELQTFLRDLNNEMKEQKREEEIKRSADEKEFKEKADKFFELIECKTRKRRYGIKSCKQKYAELLCVYFTYGKEIKSETDLLMITALRFDIQTDTMRIYLNNFKETLINFFEKVPSIRQFEILELLEYTVKYVEEYI